MGIMLALNKTPAVSLTDLKQMCRQPYSYHHIAKRNLHMDLQTHTNVHNLQLSPCKMYTLWMHIAAGTFVRGEKTII